MGELTRRVDDSYRWVGLLNDLAREFDTYDVLDYGCGDAGLHEAMTKMFINNYDPEVEAYSGEPDPADIVICANFLEYVAENDLHVIIQDLVKLTKRALVINVAMDHRGIDYWINWFQGWGIYSISGHSARELTVVLVKPEVH